MIKVGKPAPHFTSKAVVDGQIRDFGLKDLGTSYKLLLFYPLDFTFVCPTELHALQDALGEFAKRDTAVCAISVDSVYSHMSWLCTPKQQGGVQGICYPLVSDLNKDIARAYGVLQEEEGVALRGTFLLDESNVVQHASINNLSLGRSIDELLRLTDALRYVKTHGEVCPANWNQGKQAMKPTSAGVKEYFGK